MSLDDISILSFIQIQPMKIIDCFLFYNEMDLLNYRLNTMHHVVDKFVLVEATHTFTGKPKELFYDKNKERFKNYENKIIHVIVENLTNKNPWENEIFQRRKINDAIQKLELNNNDYVIISDLDEIPDCRTLLQIKQDNINLPYATFEMDLYYYNLTCKHDAKWSNSRIVSFLKYQQVFRNDPEMVRNSNVFFEFRISCGWHLCYFGDEQFIKNKIQSFSHQEYNNSLYCNEKKIKEKIKNGKDLFDRNEIKMSYVPISENIYLPPLYETFLSKYTS